MIQRQGLFLSALAVVLAAAMLVSLTLGRFPVSLPDALRILLGSISGNLSDYDNVPWVVIVIVRLPRVLLASLCGACLGLAGAAMQGVFRNPLVGPEICGVSAGASFGGVLGILLGWEVAGTVAMAFACGLGALAFALLLARFAGGRGTLALVLAGVIVGAFFSALVGLAQYVADPESKLPTIVYWLLGSFATASYPKVGVVAAAAATAGSLLLALRWRINLLSLGESDAAALGLNAEVLRWAIVAMVAVLVAAQVSVSGGVGWVGLLIPHFARFLVGPNHSRLLPASALLGAIYLLAMDDLARSLTDQEIPIGLLTAVVGTPIFAVLFRRHSNRGWSHD